MAHDKVERESHTLSDTMLGSICLGLIFAWVSFAWNGSDYAFGTAIARGTAERLFVQLGIIVACAIGAVTASRFPRASFRLIASIASISAVAVVLCAWFIPNINRDILGFFVGIEQGSLMAAWLARYRSGLSSMVLMVLAASAIHSFASILNTFEELWIVRALSVALPSVVYLLLTATPKGSSPAEDKPRSSAKANRAALLVLLAPAASLLISKMAFGFVSYGQEAFGLPTAYFVAVVSAIVALVLYRFGLPRHEFLFVGLVIAMCGCIGLSAAFPQGPNILLAVVYATSWLFNLYLLAWFAQPRIKDRSVSLSASLIGWTAVYLITALANWLALVIDSQICFVLALILTVLSLIIVLLGALSMMGEKSPGQATEILGEQSEVHASSLTTDFTSLEEHVRALSVAYELTSSEQNVLLLLAHGFSLKQIAEKLVISENTAKFHRHNVYRKLGIGSRDELISLVHTGCNQTPTSAES